MPGKVFHRIRVLGLSDTVGCFTAAYHSNPCALHEGKTSCMLLMYNPSVTWPEVRSVGNGCRCATLTKLPLVRPPVTASSVRNFRCDQNTPQCAFAT